MINYLSVLLMIVINAFAQRAPFTLKVRRFQPSWFSPEECGIERIPLQPQFSCFETLTLHQQEEKIKRYDEVLLDSAHQILSRVQGGDDTQPGEFPWVVLLSLNWTSTCTGSIIADHFVLTAAHCVYDYYPQQVIAFFGVDPPIANQQSHADYGRVYFIHPCYRPNDTAPEECQHLNEGEGKFFDIALVLFGNLTNGGVWPKNLTNPDNQYYKYNSICLTESSWIPPDFYEVYRMAGWGNMDVDGKLNESALATRLQWIPMVLSNGLFVYENVTGYSLLYFHNKPGHAICQGDSGSPIVIQSTDGRWYQMGVLIRTYNTQIQAPCAADFATVVNIEHPIFKDWIFNVFQIIFDFEKNITQGAAESQG